jgi:hypothetical protein
MSDEGWRITGEINADPAEAERLRLSRAQARDGNTVHRGWEPEGCPIARDQTLGYKHFHTEGCGASPEQIAADREDLEGKKGATTRWVAPLALLGLPGSIALILSLIVTLT